MRKLLTRTQDPHRHEVLRYLMEGGVARALPSVGAHVGFFAGPPPRRGHHGRRWRGPGASGPVDSTTDDQAAPAFARVTPNPYHGRRVGKLPTRARPTRPCRCKRACSVAWAPMATFQRQRNQRCSVTLEPRPRQLRGRWPTTMPRTKQGDCLRYDTTGPSTHSPAERTMRQRRGWGARLPNAR